jgi:hypothetical protein
MSMKLFDTNGRLGVLKAGRIVLIARPGKPVSEAQTVPGTQVVVLGGEDLVDDVAAWLDSQEIDAAARLTGIHRSTIDRMRRGLGLADSYEGSSRTTRWRKKEEN